MIWKIIRREVEKVKKPDPPEGLEEIARATLEDLEGK